jgi:hypothetical protein
VQLLFSNGMTYPTAACAAIGMSHAENTIPLLLFVETSFFAEPLLSIGCCIFPYFADAA